MPQHDDVDFGMRLQTLRLSQGLSLRQLAKKTGCSPSLLLSWENNRSSPTLGNLTKLCHALKMTPSDVLRQEMPLPEPVVIDPRADEGKLALFWNKAELRQLLPNKDYTQSTTLLLTLEEGGLTPPRKSHRPINKLCVVIQGRVRLHMPNRSAEASAPQVLYYNMYAEHQWENTGTGEAQILMFHPYSFRLFEQEEEDLSWEKRQIKLNRQKKSTEALLGKKTAGGTGTFHAA